MTLRLRRAVPALLLLAAAAAVQAADVVVMRTQFGVQRATLAEDELLVAPSVRQGGGKAQVRAYAGKTRTTTQDTARSLLAAGEASSVAPVLYMDGRIGDPNARAIATRRILFETGPGQHPATLAAAHGLRLVEAVPNRPTWWIAEPVDGGFFAAIDAARSLGADDRATMVWPMLQMPVSHRFVPNDPVFVDGYMWHLTDAMPGIHVSEVWDTYKGESTNIAISDTGIDTLHEDLALSVRVPLMHDYFFNDNDPNPAGPQDNHGTAVAGLAAAIGNNNLGIVGVAFKSGIIPSKVLNDYNQSFTTATVTATDDRMYKAMIVQKTASSLADLTWANNNSWGPVDDGQTNASPGPLMMQGIIEGVTDGRNGRGIPYIWACGNGGWVSPNGRIGTPAALAALGIQDCTAFDGYLNRYVIGVAALSHPLLTPAPAAPYVRGIKASYSESGPNLTISAPGGDYRDPRSGVLAGGPLGMVTTDRTGDPGYIDAQPQPLPPQSDFNGDWIVVSTPDWLKEILYPGPHPPNPFAPPAKPYEDGGYIPPQALLTGTSFAAPLVTGAVTLMEQARTDLSWRDVRQIMMHRGQDVLPIPFGVANRPHDNWGWWRPNAVNLNYNNWYGFGAVDVGRFVFGGGGFAGNQNTAGGRDEPGALRWPLLPPLTGVPASYSATFSLPGATDTFDPYAIHDAPISVTGDNNLVDNGVNIEYDPFDRHCYIGMPVTNALSRVRIDSVELKITLSGVDEVTYNGTAITPNGPERGAPGGYNPGEYLFGLTSPGGSRCILGRQRPGKGLDDGTPWTWTFTELFHTNEGLINGTWTLDIIDEVNNDPDGSNKPQCRVQSVDLKVYGHQTYDFPRLTGVTPTGIALGEGSQQLQLSGSNFSLSQGKVSVTQPYWDLDGLGTGTPPVAITGAVKSQTQMIATIPASQLLMTSPGQGYLTVANPAIVIGRTGTGPGAIDAFDSPNVGLPSDTTLPGIPAVGDQYMKRCPPGDETVIKYSHRPTLSNMGDISLGSGGSFSVNVDAYDVDVAAGLPLSSPETLTLTVTSFNPYFIAPGSISVTAPAAPGNGTYVINAKTTGSSSGFALVEVKVTDGVLTTSRAFRVVIPTKEDGSGCGGGMGLALLGIPLAAWIVRRRRRQA